MTCYPQTIHLSVDPCAGQPSNLALKQRNGLAGLVISPFHQPPAQRQFWADRTTGYFPKLPAIKKWRDLDIAMRIQLPMAMGDSA